MEDNWKYKYHVEKYGNPSKFGFKDVINIWKAENGIRRLWFPYIRVQGLNILWPSQPSRQFIPLR